MKKCNVSTMRKQEGFIGSIIFLLVLIGLSVVLFTGRVMYNNYNNQSEVFSFQAFGYNFRMMQELSLKEKVKATINNTIDAVKDGTKEVVKAVDEVAEDRGVKDFIKEEEKKSKKSLEEADKVIGEKTQEVSESGTKTLKKIGESTVSIISGVIKDAGEKVDQYKNQ